MLRSILQEITPIHPRLLPRMDSILIQRPVMGSPQKMIKEMSPLLLWTSLIFPSPKMWTPPPQMLAPMWCFTLTINNDGPSDATSVQVADVIPSGFTYISDDGAGDYDDGTGIWDVGTLAMGNTEILNITASVNPTGTYTNTGEITAHDQADVDSTPNNGLLAEDDQDNVVLTPIPLVDISVNSKC